MLNKNIFYVSHDIAQERTRKLKLSFLISVFSKGANMLVILISTPLILNYLGAEKFGVLNALLSTLAVVMYSDLGLSMGLQNSLPALIAKNEQVKIKSYISTTFYFLVFAAFTIIILSIIVVFYVDWPVFFNTKNISNDDFRNAIIVYLLVVSIGIPVSVVQRTQSAYQDGYFTEIWTSVGNLASLIAVSIAMYFKGDIAIIILSMQGMVYLFGVFNFIYTFVLKKKYAKPNFLYFDVKLLRSLIKIGLSFLFLQICSLFINSADNILILKIFGPSQVTHYTIAFRIISFLAMPVQLLSVPLLAAYNDAWERGDKNWIKDITIKLFKIAGLGSILGGTFFIFFGNTIAKHWTNSVEYTTYQLILFGIFFLYLNFNSLISMIALSNRFLKLLLVIYPIATVVTICAKYFVLQYFSDDYSNITIATFIPLFFLFFLPVLHKIYKEDFKV